ncbi:hypothetical protein ACVWZD_005855 [Streptomyces sp. TE3672]
MGHATSAKTASSLRPARARPDYRIERFGTKLGDLRVTNANRFEDGKFDGEFADWATALTLPKSSPSTPL